MKFRENLDDVKILRKYTTLPVLLDILYRNKLTLLKPDSWSDRNDVKVMLHYQELYKPKLVLATCFSFGAESVYHWNAFSNGNAGCMIEINAKKFFEKLSSYQSLVCGKIKYLKINQISNNNFHVNDLPFLKRFPYECEDEIRLVTLVEKDMPYYEIDFPLSCISAIKLSPELPKSVVESVKCVLKEMIGSKIKINQSTLLENNKWMKNMSKIGK